MMDISKEGLDKAFQEALHRVNEGIEVRYKLDKAMYYINELGIMPIEVNARTTPAQTCEIYYKDWILYNEYKQKTHN